MRVGYAILGLTLTACAANDQLPDSKLTIGDKTLSVADLVKTTPAVDVDIEDPQYGRAKHYKAVRLAPIMNATFEAPEKLQFLIRATDGYAIPTTGEVLMQDGAYLAFRDREVPNWEPVGPHKVSPGPFYLVWRSDVKDLPWPYAMQQIQAVTLKELYAKADPGPTPPESVSRGFDLFLHCCIKCHAINGQGGNLGPELNIKKNVTEYWSESLIKDYIKDPTSLRNGNMPPNPDLSEKDIDDVYAYLSAMKDHKL